QEASADSPTSTEAVAALQVPEPPVEGAVAPLQGADFESLLKELGVAELPKDGPPLIPAAQHLELARRLKALGYLQYVSVVATHWKAGFGRKGADANEPEHFEVVTVVRTIGKGSRT